MTPERNVAPAFSAASLRPSSNIPRKRRAVFAAPLVLFFTFTGSAQAQESTAIPLGDEEGGTEPGEEGAATEGSADSAEAASSDDSPSESEESSREGTNDFSSAHDAKNTLYLELFGPGLLYSLNYERRIQDVNLRVGVGGAAWMGSGYLTIPVGATYTGVGNELHHLELGATVTFILAGDSFSTASTVAFQPIIGYRRQAREGGYSFRAGLSPWVSSNGILPWAYVSFGFGF